jgi:iron complex outermembrane receptor protein
MKRIFLFGLLAFSQLSLFSQVILKGKVLEKESGNPLAAVSIVVENQSAVSDDNGFFELKLKSPGGTIEISHVEFQSLRLDLADLSNKVTQQNGSYIFYLERKPFFLSPVEVMATRSGNNAPFTKTNLSRKDIEKANLGQDFPFLLNQTPSTVVNSDAGNGIGYTGLRIRGSDLSRVNVTLNGIPYNDPESQGVFFVDLPDIASSISSIQIQRGVGTSSNGAGAFGATLNIATNEFNEKPYAEISSSYGSFNSWKNTIRVGTGLINNHFTLDARLSKISSDGYIDRATSDLHSFYLSGAYVNNNTQIRFNVIGGKEKTYQAWYGVPQDSLATHRTFNPAGTEKPGEPYNNETDNYQQDHYQLFVNHSFNSSLTLNLAFFLTKGKGYYEEYRAAQHFSDYGLEAPVIGADTISSTDLIRQLWLDNNFYGGVFSFQYKKNLTQLTLGGGWNEYDGDHFGKVIWSAIGFPNDYEWYRNNAVKKDINFYGKWQQQLNEHWQSFADLQYRNVPYDLYGFDDNPSLVVRNNYHFLNPKIGFTYTNRNLKGYISYALANKEPNRDDFEAGLSQQPTFETLNDFELGIQQSGSQFDWNLVAYYMRYHNQLVLTGKINDVGAYTRTNIPKSYRVGLEAIFTYRLTPQLRWDVNVAVSENKVLNFTEYLDDYDNGGQKVNQYSKTDISFSPPVIVGSTISWRPLQQFDIALLSKYVSAQYLDNTSNNNRKLDAFFLNDLRVTYTIPNKLFKEINLIGQLNNMFNAKYEPSGYTYSYLSGGEVIDQNYYYPMAGTNFVAGVNLKF